MELKSTHKIFEERILRIPSYQRGYTWSNNFLISKDGEYRQLKGQLKDIWDDLMNIPDNNWHYTGLLTLVESISEYNWLANHKQFSIVDGQQRITTILILIQVIITKAKINNIQLEIRKDDELFKYLYIDSGSSKAFIFGYEKDNPSDKYFKKHILCLDDIEDDSKESIYTENLKNAKLFFEFMVDSFCNSGIQRIKELYVKVTTNLRFNEYILPKELDEYVVFETMNNRGKPLSELEKLKNRLMYLNSKLPLYNPKNEILSDEHLLLENQCKTLEKNINTAWITIYNSLGENKAFPLSDEDFLKNHWIMYFDRYNRSESNAYSSYIFDQYFILQNVYDQIIDYGKINFYIKSLQKASKVWSKIHHTILFKPEENNIQEAVNGLYRVGLRPSFKPLLMAILLKENTLEYLPSIRLLEEFAFKIFHISDRQSNTGDSKLYKLAYRVYEQGLTNENVFAEIKQFIGWYYQFSLFKNQVIELFEYGDRNGYYAWSGRFYFFFEYDLYLRNENKTTTAQNQLKWQDFLNKNSIEHIFPQSATLSFEEYANGDLSEKKIEDYNQIMSNWSAFADYTPIQRRCFANSLGNLLAISSSDNSSFKNDPFIYKKDKSHKGEKYINRGYTYDSMSARIVANELEWTPVTIINRGKEMLKFLWHKLHPNEKFEFTENELLELLGVGFYNQEKI